MKYKIPLIIVSILIISIFLFLNNVIAHPEIPKMIDFLKNNYNQSLKLCREAPQAAPNTYWVVSDNLLVCALKDFQPTISNISSEICDKIKNIANEYNLPTNINGLPIDYKHEALIGETIPLPFNTTNNYTLVNDTYQIKTEVSNGTDVMNDWEEYADLLLYGALSYHNSGNESKAIELYSKAKAMWDGTGINDKVTQNNGTYAMYKLSLLVYVSRILNQPLEFKNEINARILLQQRDDGGIITDYNSSGETLGDANTETTAITIIAFYLIGDVNRDCIINIFDLASVGLAYGSSLNTPYWNQNADVNNDGTIDITDLIVVGTNFWKMC